MMYLWAKFAKHKIRYKRHGRIDKHAKKGICTHALPEREPYSAGNSRKDRRFTPDTFPMDQLGKWEEMKIGMTLTREQQISALHRQVAEINKAIQSREEGKRYATPSEADTLGKLAATIKKLESDVGISDIISVGMRFSDWLRPQDPDMTKTFIRLFDQFIKDNL